ncbi:cytochrome ubiquinol oxidase subunit I [Nonomuraea sp. NPDC048882]|uniref:cytochrome ubiquinol oxidase subunit I n=1 Tax=unclassified Nonomuraea TaxID=2593643 RepID=UPI0033C087A9
MDLLLLSRLQFAATASIHFLFVALSLGLVVFVATMQTMHVITGKDVYSRMTRFWGTLYVINYAVGIITGLVMEFQIGLNWSGLARLTGDVFGVPLALETLIGFVAEATFLGMWIFGWNRLPAPVHLCLIWLVAAASYVTAFWIMVANSFLQHPVGYELREGQARLTDFGALLTNPALTDAFLHLISAALLTGALFVAGISSWQLLRRTADADVFRRSLRWGLLAAPLGGFSAIHWGFVQENVVERYQPVKLAAMSGTLDGAGLAPPSWIIVPFEIMKDVAYVVSWGTFLFLLLTIGGRILRMRFPLYVLIGMLPLPFLAVSMGWLVREVGRQPWVVWGVLRTDQAVSDLEPVAVAVSSAGFVTVLVSLAVMDYWLLAKFARRGVSAATFGAAAVGDEVLPLRY